MTLLVDDFRPQPYQGDSVYFYNRLGGDRGALEESHLSWGHGQLTVTVASGHSQGGLWMSLNHPIRERQTVNFSAVLPPQIPSSHQSAVTGLTVQVARGILGKTLRSELKDLSSIRWSGVADLNGGRQVLSYDLPPLTDITELVLVLDHAWPGDYVVLDQLSLTTTTQITQTAQAAFVWSYGMLLNNWDPFTGLVRDRARYTNGDFDAVQATGSLAAATAVANQLGIIDRVDALQIVNKISNTLLIDLPRYHGLWPHFVEVLPSNVLTIAQSTEWSTVDTAIAAIALLDAQVALGLDTVGTEQMLREIDWVDLRTLDGLSHGYTYKGEPIAHAWDTFGGESWLLALVYAATTQQVPPIKYAAPPTANGSGFIDELAWLLVLPPSAEDHWGTDWTSYRAAAAGSQLSYHCTNYPTSCPCQFDFFGLSAAEVPIPSMVPKEHIYQAFGVGGRLSPANDGSLLLGEPVIIPHYSAMVAYLHPAEATNMWTWLINQGPFSPLNNVESLMFMSDSDCNATEIEWNQLKGSWNLALQTLGWGRYLARQRGEVPILWRATLTNELLHDGYDRLVPNGVTSVYLPFAINR